MSRLTSWNAFAEKLEQRLASRAAADWSRRRTFRLAVRDHKFTEAEYVGEYVTADGFGHVWVRDDSEDGFALVDVCEPEQASAFYRYVAATMGEEDGNCEWVESIEEIQPPPRIPRPSVIDLLPFTPRRT